MLLKGCVKNNKLITPFELIDGDYIIYIHKINTDDVESIRRLYFYFVDLVHKETGNDKKFLHLLFKKNYEIESTEELTTPQEWFSFIEKTKWLILEKFDICL